MPKSLNLTEGTITDTAIAYAMSKKAPSEFTRLKNEFEKIKISYHGNLWNKYKEHCTFENIEKLEQSAKRYIPGDDEKKLGIKGLYELGNLYIDNILNMEVQHGMTGVVKIGEQNGMQWIVKEHQKKEKLVFLQLGKNHYQ